jgi:hypothetical protein
MAGILVWQEILNAILVACLLFVRKDQKKAPLKLETLFYKLR